MMSNEDIERVEDEEQHRLVAVAPQSQHSESHTSAEIATLITPVISECVSAVSTLLTPPPQGEMVGAGAIPSNQPLPLLNSTCLKATCGGALLLAGIAGYGARAFMQRIPANADGLDHPVQNQPKTVQPRKQTRQESVASVVQFFEKPTGQTNYYFSTKKNEIMTLGMGQGGNKIHEIFWDGMLDEHKLDDNGKHTGESTDKEVSRLEVYMRIAGDRYIPRACVVDLESGTEDLIKASRLGPLIKPDNMVFGTAGAANNWAKGFYTEGAELKDEVMDVIRKEVETMDGGQGFTIFHTLGGGTGSGMGSLICENLRDGYADKMISTVSVHPSPKVSDTVTEPYNAVLTYNRLLENSDSTFIADNEALYNISLNVLKKREASYFDLNYTIKCSLLGVTAPFRFPTAGEYDDLWKQNMGLVPFPRLHFFTMAHAPIIPENSKVTELVSANSLIGEVTNPRNFLSNIKPSDGKYLAQAYTFRGDFQQNEISDALDYYKAKEEEFVSFVPFGDGMMQSHVEVAPSTAKQTCTMVCNTTANKVLFQNLATQFGVMFKRKAFLHWYKDEGMDEEEFQEADKNVRDLITEYQDKEDVVIEDEE